MNNEQAKQAQDQVHMLAALVGSTQAEMNKLEGDIVSSSNNLQTGHFQGKSILQGHIDMVKGSGDLSQAAQQVAPAQVHEASPPPPPPPDIIDTPSSPPQPVQSYGSELTLILQKLVEIEGQVSTLNSRIRDIEYFDKKVIDSLTRGLKSKVKQVTIKLDDTKSNQ